MSQLEQYDLPDLIAVESESNPKDASQTRPITIMPGVLVRHKDWPKSLGTALTRAWGPSDKPMQVLVLWSVCPGTFTMPNVRRVSPQLIANELVKIQPMTLPAGLIFYLDYQYGSGSV